MTAPAGVAAWRARWRAVPAPVRSMLVVGAMALCAGGGQVLWQRHAVADTGARIAALAPPGTLRMLSSVTCPVCVQARRYFEANRVPFDECLIERDAACRAAFDAAKAPGTPVILVAGRPTLGFSPQRLLATLEARPRATGG